MRILTCNLRGAEFEDGADHWSFRRDICVEAVKEPKAEIICFQEMLQVQRDLFCAELPDYHSVSALDVPEDGRPVNTILYRRDLYIERSAGAYWLSETPHVCGSRSWESHCPRYAVWVILEERATGKRFRVVNTHLDHIGQAARERQAMVIDEESAAYPESLPQILTGDMNCDIENKAIAEFFRAGWRDSWFEATGVREPGITFHEFEGPAFCRDMGEQGSGKIDWIFVRGPIQVTASAILDRPGKTGRYPSDHYFVSADLVLS